MEKTFHKAYPRREQVSRVVHVRKKEGVKWEGELGTEGE